METVSLHEDLSDLRDKLLSLRRMAVINPYTSISWNMFSNELHVYTDGGRCTRPLLIVNQEESDKGVKSNKLRLNTSIVDNIKNGSWDWKNLINQNLHSNTNYHDNSNITDNLELKEGIIEYVDVEEAS